MENATQVMLVANCCSVRENREFRGHPVHKCMSEPRGMSCQLFIRFVAYFLQKRNILLKSFGLGMQWGDCKGRSVVGMTCKLVLLQVL